MNNPHSTSDNYIYDYKEEVDYKNNVRRVYEYDIELNEYVLKFGSSIESYIK